MKITRNAYAKINLTLDVLNKRSDGYHNIISIMQTLGLCDAVTIERTSEGINGRWNHDKRFTKENTAYRAAELLLRRYNLPGGVNINIDKRIPISAGLGGGSADAAAVLEGMNELFGLNLSQEELMSAGIEIGADVPFCLLKGTAIAEGIGDRLTRLNSGIRCHVLLVKPDIEISTKAAYEKIDRIKLKHRPDTSATIEAVKAGDIKNLGRNMRNVMELVTAAEHSVIDELKRKMILKGACGATMSGSGPTVFGLFESRLLAENAYACLRGEYDYETIACGFYNEVV